MLWLLLLMFLGVVNSLKTVKTKETFIKENPINLKHLFKLFPVTLQNAIFLSRLLAVPDFNFIEIFEATNFSTRKIKEWLEFCVEHPEFIDRIFSISFLTVMGRRVVISQSLIRIASNFIQKSHGMILNKNINFFYSPPEFVAAIFNKAGEDESTVIKGYNFCNVSIQWLLENEWWKHYSSLCLGVSMKRFEIPKINFGINPIDILKILRLLFAATLSDDANFLRMKLFMLSHVNSIELENLADHPNAPLLINIERVWFDNGSDPVSLLALYNQIKNFVTDHTDANSRIKTSFMIDLLLVGIERGIDINRIIQDFQALLVENDGKNLNQIHLADIKFLRRLLNETHKSRVNEFFESDHWKRLTLRLPRLIPSYGLDLQARLQRWQFKYRKSFSHDSGITDILNKLFKGKKIMVFPNEDFPQILNDRTRELLTFNDIFIRNANLGRIVLSAMANDVKLKFPALMDFIKDVYAELRASKRTINAKIHTPSAHLFRSFELYGVFKTWELSELLIE